MKVLIADDEIFTREGIIEQIPWDSLSITEIQQAYDGLNALDIASVFEPDILLTDVRMPRMDGVELSFKLRELYPSCEIIFMSGYSDKEYLKSAIKLKAVSYVEKPIDIDELENALRNAVASKSKDIKTKENIKRHMSLELIHNHANTSMLKEFFDCQTLNQLMHSNFITVLVDIVNSDTLIKENILNNIQNMVVKNGYNCMSCFKDDRILLLHLYWDMDKKQLSKHHRLELLFNSLSNYLRDYSDFFLAVGRQVAGFDKIYESYESASENLNKSFYYDHNSIIYPSSFKSPLYKHDDKLFDELRQYLYQEDNQHTFLLIKRLTSEIKQCKDTPVNYIKEIYFFLFLQLVDFASERKLGLTDNDFNNKLSFEKFSEFRTIYETESYIIEKAETIFNYLSEKNMAGNPIVNIMKYIHDHYADIDLSLQSISENTYLTPNYICTIFKNNTGKTINKYILQYRISKAKEMLRDRKMKINDIAAKVGYSDGNYFTKTFKKETGLTPSEYRQKNLT
ncbi:response regulator transcription factor [Clostridium thermarum]|uniref:response regulator transcription factor n=1 Tax=Clostridium thermarum TaxID=1716543 RepID=UPI001121566C|nr:response regulator [Clostridium thermarum]